jgi:oligopeptide transport system ATP-binding protein
MVTPLVSQPAAAVAPPVLEIKDLKTQYFTQEGVVAAIDGLSLTVAPSQIVGLVGESGCGKSTAALSIMRLLPPLARITAGEIVLDGTNVVTLSSAEMRGRRGPVAAMIFQDALAALDPTMKIGPQIQEALMLHLGLPRTEAARRTVELLASVGIPGPEKRVHQYPHQFSGGMRQRVMIAMALACNPRLLLADEPTTALDVTVQHQILDLMLSLRDQTGAGIILITHDVGVVAETCDTVVVMYAGREAESGPTQAVFTSPRHPYTIGLLGSTLELGRDKSKPLRAVPGLPPDLIEVPPGCLFWPRCERHTEICKTEQPPLEPVGDGGAFIGHRAACHHMDGR